MEILCGDRRQGRDGVASILRQPNEMEGIGPVDPDPGPLVATADRADKDHEACRQLLESDEGPLVTTAAEPMRPWSPWPNGTARSGSPHSTGATSPLYDHVMLRRSSCCHSAAAAPDHLCQQCPVPPLSPQSGSKPLARTDRPLLRGESEAADCGSAASSARGPPGSHPNRSP